MMTIGTPTVPPESTELRSAPGLMCTAPTVLSPAAATARKGMQINNRTSPRALRQHFRATDGSFRITLDGRMGREALLSLIQRFAPEEELGDFILQLIPFHPRADEAVFQALSVLATTSTSIANALATSMRTPVVLLRTFARHPNYFVRDHARRALSFRMRRSQIGTRDRHPNEPTGGLPATEGHSPGEPRDRGRSQVLGR